MDMEFWKPVCMMGLKNSSSLPSKGGYSVNFSFYISWTPASALYPKNTWSDRFSPLKYQVIQANPKNACPGRTYSVFNIEYITVMTDTRCYRYKVARPKWLSRRRNIQIQKVQCFTLYMRSRSWSVKAGNSILTQSKQKVEIKLSYVLK